MTPLIEIKSVPIEIEMKVSTRSWSIPVEQRIWRSHAVVGA